MCRGGARSGGVSVLRFSPRSCHGPILLVIRHSAPRSRGWQQKHLHTWITLRHLPPCPSCAPQVEGGTAIATGAQGQTTDEEAVLALNQLRSEIIVCGGEREGQLICGMGYEIPGWKGAFVFESQQRVSTAGTDALVPES